MCGWLGENESGGATRFEGAPPSHALLLDDGDLVGRPPPVEAVRHANSQTDGRDRLPGEVLGVKDDDVAQVAFRVVDIKT